VFSRRNLIVAGVASVLVIGYLLQDDEQEGTQPNVDDYSHLPPQALIEIQPALKVDGLYRLPGEIAELIIRNQSKDLQIEHINIIGPTQTDCRHRSSIELTKKQVLTLEIDCDQPLEVDQSYLVGFITRQGRFRISKRARQD